MQLELTAQDVAQVFSTPYRSTAASANNRPASSAGRVPAHRERQHSPVQAGIEPHGPVPFSEGDVAFGEPVEQQETGFQLRADRAPVALRSRVVRGIGEAIHQPGRFPYPLLVGSCICPVQ